MPTLNWIGKDKVINHHHDVPLRTLERKYSFDSVHGQTEKDNSSENMIIHGDNLEALKALLPKYEGKIDCVYIDPPYNTGNENWVYNDNVNDPIIRKWLGEVVGAEGEDLSRHDKWLCMMYPRLRLLQKLLSDDGLIFISIDYNELSNLLSICNEIFGRSNYITSISWKSRAKPSNTGRAKYAPQNDSEFIICYKKKNMPSFIRVLSGNERSYPHHDIDGNYRLQTILKSNRGESKRETMCFGLNGWFPPPTKRWQAGEDTIIDLWNRNRITFETGEPMLKYYEHEEKEEISPFWCHVPKDVSNTAENGKKLLNKIIGNLHGFDTVKPIEIMNYIISHSCDKNALILDSFAGSGTTAHSVLDLNKKEDGNRKFILIEFMDYAESITSERIKRVINGYTDVSGTGGSFSFFELGEPLFNSDSSLNEAISVEGIRQFIWFTETRSKYKKPTEQFSNHYYLGSFAETDYYFYYDRNQRTTLTFEFLATITKKNTSYVIYADTCTIEESDLVRLGIVYKKIPRDISKL